MRKLIFVLTLGLAAIIAINSYGYRLYDVLNPVQPVRLQVDKSEVEDFDHSYLDIVNQYIAQHGELRSVDISTYSLDSNNLYFPDIIFDNGDDYRYGYSFEVYPKSILFKLYLYPEWHNYSDIVYVETVRTLIALVNQSSNGPYGNSRNKNIVSEHIDLLSRIRSDIAL